MATKNYTTTTAALKATTADIRVLDVKKVSANSLEVDGVDVMDAIDAAKQAAIDGAKVTLIQGTGITVTPNNTPSNSFTVAVDNTVATTQSVTDLAGRVTTAEGEIDALQETVNGLTSGDNSVDSKIAAAKTEIAGTEIFEQTVSGAGISVTLDGTVGAPTLTGSVTTATYTKATENAAGSWSDETQVVTAGAVKSALADVDAKHTADIEKVEAAIESLSTSGFSREIVTELPTTDIKLNAIYLVANKESDANEYVEYIYVGGTVTDGQVGGGRFEQIGTTKTDLSEYAKTADVNASFEATNAEVAKKANQTALDATNTTVDEHTTAIAALNGTTIPAITDRLDALEAIPAVEVVHAEGTTDAPNYVTVSSSTADGKTTFTVSSTGALETRLDTLESFIGGSDTPGQGLSELLAKKVDNVAGGSNGITITTADGTDGRVATLAVTADTIVTKDSLNVVTSGAVESAISTSASTTLDSAKGYTDGQIGALKTAAAGTVTAANTAVSVTQTDAKVTAIEVTKGAIVNENTNLVDGGTVYAVTSAIETRLSNVETAADTGVDSKIAAAIGDLNATPSANGITVTQVGGVITAVAAAPGEVAENNENVVHGGVVYAAITKAISDQAALDAAAYAVKGTEAAAQTAQTTADAKVENITTNDGRITLTPTTKDKVKSVEIALASTVATVDGTDDEAGTVYTKAQVDEKVTAAKPANYVTAVKVGETSTTGEATVEVEAKTEATHFGSELISASLADSKVTITAAPAKEWSVGTDKPDTGITSVINGKMSDGSTIDDANLTDGTSMFAGNTALTTYVGDLSKLTNGTSMFSGCTGLTTFVANLSSLTNGTNMFAGCKLTEESLIYIVDSLPTFPAETASTHTITVRVADGVVKDSYVTEAAAKGWTLE